MNRVTPQSFCCAGLRRTVWTHEGIFWALAHILWVLVKVPRVEPLIKEKENNVDELGDDQALVGRSHALGESRSELAVDLKRVAAQFSPRN
jgi:hypothetical protein